MEFGIFNDEARDYTVAEAAEAGFFSEEAALAAIRTRYAADDDLYVHRIEERDDECEE